jgi:glycosyltransferase involved in cell wall biosynthesis
MAISMMMAETAMVNSTDSAKDAPRLRILISAYGCEPDKGSEQGVGWNWVLQMSRFADLVVVTRANNEAAIEVGLPEFARGRITFVYHDAPAWVRKLKRKDRGLYPYYLVWQWGAYRLAKDLCAKTRFDYAMHLTFGSVWMPTFMHRLDVPFIWGPIGGAEAVPFSMISDLPLNARALQYLRHALVKTFGINPFYALIIRRSVLVLARTIETQLLFPISLRSKVHVILETGISEEWLQLPGASVNLDIQPIDVIYTGRLVTLKNVESAIEATAKAIHMGADVRLRIVGDGPLNPHLQKLAHDNGIADRVTFLGQISQKDVIAALQASAIYLFPSLKEGGVWSLMEAMALGLPAICVRTSGMAVIGDDTSVAFVEPSNRRKMVDDLAWQLHRLATSPELRESLGRQARLRLERDFRWESKSGLLHRLILDHQRAVLTSRI